MFHLIEAVDDPEQTEWGEKKWYGEDHNELRATSPSSQLIQLLPIQHSLLHSGTLTRYSLPYLVHPYPDCDWTFIGDLASDRRSSQWLPTTAHEILQAGLRKSASGCLSRIHTGVLGSKDSLRTGVDRNFREKMIQTVIML